MASKVLKITMNNGLEIPQIGLGTWSSAPGEVDRVVKDAIDVGYRHFDTAQFYGNEAEIGAAIQEKINEGVIEREDVFITTKLWSTFHRPDLVIGAIEESLKNLKIEYLDLYLMHWPFAFQEDGDLFPYDDDGNILFSEVDYVDTWKAMEEAVDSGLVRSIGISNFNAAQAQRVMDECSIKPVTNQIECHPYFTQQKMDEFLKSNDIVFTAYSPLGSPARLYFQKENEPLLLEEPKVLAIAEKYDKTPAQVLIRYQIERGHVVLPKSVTKERIVTNFDVFDFELTSEDVEEINSLHSNTRLITMSGDGFEASHHPHYPFHDEF